MNEKACVPCALVLGENDLLYSVCRPLGVLVARRQRQRPSGLVWSGVDKFCAGDVETPLSWWRTFLVEPGAKVTVIVFTEETWWPRSNTLL